MIVAIKISEDSGLPDAGTVIHLDEDKAQKLVDSGLAEYAEEGDVNGEGDDEAAVDDSPEVVEASVRGLARKNTEVITKAAERATRELVKKSPRIVPDMTVPAKAIDRKCGFKNLAEFCQTKAASFHGNTGASNRLRLVEKVNNYNSEGVPADGGSLIPIEFSQEVWQRAWGNDPVLSRLKQYPIRGNDLKVRALGRYQGANGGATSYWISEGNAITQSKVIAETVELKLSKLAVLCEATNELLQDEPESFEQILKDDVSLQLNFAMNDAIFNGAGSQANLLSDTATITVKRATANTIQYKDLAAMLRHVHAPSRKNCKVYYNPSVEDQLLKMAFVDSTGTFPAWVLPGFGSSSEAPSGKLFGMEMIPCENLPALGTNGDIVFADLSQVGCAYKQIEGAVSAHVFFVQDQTAFRFVFRVATKSLWTQQWVRPDGTNASPVVTLDTASHGSA
jgi:HK97 family phage major capsid protein